MHDYDKVKQGGSSLYEHDASYEEIPDSSYQHSKQWEEYCYLVKHESRFYNTKAKSILDDLLSFLNSVEYIGEYAPIRKIGPNSDITHIYRARRVKSDDEIKKFYFKAYKELGPPPRSKATPGRMNAEGIPVLYGATDFHTCIAEIRLPVGCKAIVAKLEIIRPLTVLDLTIFSRIYERLSLFDPEFETKASRLIFLREFEEKISEPIMLNENVFNYIPTQAFAEYLANQYVEKIDAVIYSSTQSIGESTHNIVILPHASTVEWPETSPEYELISPYGLTLFDNELWILDQNEIELPDSELFLNEVYTDYNIVREPNLRVVGDEIFMVNAQSIKYQTREYKVLHPRIVKNENEP